MLPQDVEFCRALVKVLKSEKHSKFNTIFLNPFDLSQTPGYLDICGKAMDLSTLSQNIENGLYSTRREFYDDCNLIFENAIKYHSDKDTTKWIVSPAKQMLKIAKREQQKTEKKVKAAAGVRANKLKLKLGGSGSSGTTTSANTKPKIKIKQPAARATGATIASRGKTPPPGVKIGTSVSPSSKPPPNKKTRLTLKIKSNTQSTSSALKSTSTKKSNNSAIGGASGGASRGKELPKVSYKFFVWHRVLIFHNVQMCKNTIFLHNLCIGCCRIYVLWTTENNKKQQGHRLEQKDNRCNGI